MRSSDDAPALLVAQEAEAKWSTTACAARYHVVDRLFGRAGQDGVAAKSSQERFRRQFWNYDRQKPRSLYQPPWSFGETTESKKLQTCNAKWVHNVFKP
jgi:hypothetical protein